MRNITSLIILILSTALLYSNIAIAGADKKTENDPLSPDGVTFVVKYEWRDSWGRKPIVTRYYIDLYNDGIFVGQFREDYAVGEYGAYWQKKFAVDAVNKLRLLVADAKKREKKLSIKYDGTEYYIDDLVIIETEEVAENNPQQELEIADEREEFDFNFCLGRTNTQPLNLKRKGFHNLKNFFRKLSQNNSTPSS